MLAGRYEMNERNEKNKMVWCGKSGHHDCGNDHGRDENGGLPGENGGGHCENDHGHGDHHGVNDGESGHDHGGNGDHGSGHGRCDHGGEHYEEDRRC